MLQSYFEQVHLLVICDVTEQHFPLKVIHRMERGNILMMVITVMCYLQVSSFHVEDSLTFPLVVSDDVR